MTGQIPPLPAGYKLEQPQQGSIPPLPPGYSLEASSVTSRPSVPRPSVDMQMSNTGIALNPTGSVAGPGEGSYVAEADPESQARMLGAATIGAGGAAAAAGAGAAPAVARKAIAWISANPLKAYLLVKGASELGVHPLKWLHLAAGVEPEPE